MAEGKGAYARVAVFIFTAVFAVTLGVTSVEARRTPTPTPTPGGPPAPVLVSPANGVSLVQPITLDWNPVSAQGGPIGSYTWQVGTTSTFTTVIAPGSRIWSPIRQFPRALPTR